MSEFNQKEEDTFRADLFRRMDVQDITLARIEEQTKKTNGRVTVLETVLTDYSDYKKLVISIKDWKIWVSGICTLAVLIGAFVFNLIIRDVNRTAEENIRVQLEAAKKDIVKEAVSEIDQRYNLRGLPAEQ